MTASSSAAGSPRFLYLHGFASGQASKKGVALAQHFAGLGVTLERLDLRVPTAEGLRTSAMIATTRAAIGGAPDRAVLFGSSLGGLTACLVAEIDPRVCALVLLAPALRLAERWRARLGEPGFARWRETGWLEIDDHVLGTRARIDFGFFTDAEQLEPDGRWPDVRVPTLIIHGRADDVVDIDRSRSWAAGKRHVHLIEVDDGHELVASLPRIATEAQRFLAPFLG